MTLTGEEIVSQPATWAAALARLPEAARVLPGSGEAVAVIGCGTSYFVAECYARARELSGAGVTDAVVASEFTLGARPYDRLVAISRSGTTTEVVRVLESAPSSLGSVAVCAVDDSPVVAAAGTSILLGFADERSVVQTRFATSTILLLRAHLGEDVGQAIADAGVAVIASLPAVPADFTHFVFLGTGWTVGLADEAALKMREAALAWSESYPAMEYRHGPISLADRDTLVWAFGVDDADLLRDIRATGATVVGGAIDPLAELVLVQRLAVDLAEAKGLDPDHPRHLTRSVVLS
ncbi:MAG: SIS domain-containing protein [Actinobacteria bacterium]|nr:SIS domain-containing protein [Actinomycetota bacterium]